MWWQEREVALLSCFGEVHVGMLTAKESKWCVSSLRMRMVEESTKLIKVNGISLLLRVGTIPAIDAP